AGFHSLKQFKNQIPDNIRLIRIPPYSPELNPSEKMWAYIKKYYKNLFFETIQDVKQWLADFVNNKIDEQIVKSITHNEKFLNVFNAQFMV
ncbi:MAG: transposase, partial [Marinifilum sp.]|nr:transposase [Marinifilum sp.]